MTEQEERQQHRQCKRNITTKPTEHVNNDHVFGPLRCIGSLQTIILYTIEVVTPLPFRFPVPSVLQLLR